MLVLTRKAGEAVRIGDNIEIVVVEILGNAIRLGIEAPREVRVLRSELEGTEPSAKETASVVEKPAHQRPAASHRPQRRRKGR